MLNLYNTLTKQAESIEKQRALNLYTCGPTVYNFQHIGNMRSFIMADILYRTLKYEGYNPKWVMNITDVDDKTIRDTIKKYGAGASIKELREFTDFYFEEFKKDLVEVGVSPDVAFICVSDIIPDIQKFIIDLVKKGYGYVADDGIYFSIEKYQKDFSDYGQLVGEKFLEGKKVGARVAVDEYEKDNLSDFVLWKARNTETDGNIFWGDLVNDPEIKIPDGRPGWHIECSVINKVGFEGQPTDIHTGGVDLIFPHHTNEIAQSQPFHKPFSKYWHHNEHLLVDGSKMAKRLNNFYTVNDLLAKGFSGQDLRYFFLTSGFLNQQNFTFEALGAAKTAKDKLLELPHNETAAENFLGAVNENLNLPQALAVIWSSGSINSAADNILGFKKEAVEPIPADIQSLVEDRKLSKDNKDFKKSDELRKQIESAGYEVMDTPDGQKVKKKIMK